MTPRRAVTDALAQLRDHRVEIERLPEDASHVTVLFHVLQNLGRCGGDHKDPLEQVRLSRADATENLGTVHPRQHHVQEDRVIRITIAFDRCRPVVTALNDIRREAVPLQDQLEQATQRPIVFDDQYAAHGEPKDYDLLRLTQREMWG
ncbi:MAG TPA: hypothetical protein VGJ82_08975 [Thermoanaerobaculia bacterium]